MVGGGLANRLWDNANPFDNDMRGYSTIITLRPPVTRIGAQLTTLLLSNHLHLLLRDLCDF